MPQIGAQKAVFADHNKSIVSIQLNAWIFIPSLPVVIAGKA